MSDETTEERIARRLCTESARLCETDRRAIARVMAEELDRLREEMLRGFKAARKTPRYR